MSTPYYIHKIKSALLSRFATPLTRRYKAKGVLAGGMGDFQFAGRFILYFADPPLIHLGDQLFHQPLINLLRESYDIRVALAGDAFSSFYESQGIQTISQAEFSSVTGAVIITKEDLAHSVSSLFPPGNLFLGFNYQAFDSEERITVLLTKHILDMLDRWQIEHKPMPDCDSDDFRPYVPEKALASLDTGDLFKEITADPNARWLVFNDFVNSGYVQAAKRRHMLHSVARERKAAGDRLIYVGTNSDRYERPDAPDFIDLDVRGAFGPLGLYKLFSLPNVVGTVSYDTFVMHVASAFYKDLYVVARKANGRERLRRTYIPMFPGAESTVKLYL
jgi:hypothetical protein